MSRSGGSGIELARRSSGVSVHDTRCRRFADPLGALGRRPRRRLGWGMAAVVEFVVVEAERLRPGHNLCSPVLMRGRWEVAARCAAAAVGAAAAGAAAAGGVAAAGDEPAAAAVVAAAAGQLAIVVVGVAAVVVAAVPGGKEPTAANDYYAE